MGRNVLNNPEYIEIAKSYGKNINQLALRWSIQNGFIPLARSSNPTHMKENMDIFDFEISSVDIERINELNSNTNYQDIWSYKRQQMY